MLNQHHREKVINAAVYFIENTVNCQKTKLLKLLYLLDFEHYRQVGRTVTGLKYQAWREGPPEIFEEVEDPAEDWKQHIEVSYNPVGYQGTSPTWDLNAKKAFDDNLFSQRELAILKEVSDQYKTHTAQSLIDICHSAHPWSIPWQKVWEEQERHWADIDLELFLQEAENEDKIRELSVEHEEMVRNYS